mmetsp:Transcript_74356/g.120026  ORF Transcript_74356/g.120026 Transcript_74356/m.120026 type:complete len:102 (-) Transcript_74356:6-311(-)
MGTKLSVTCLAISSGMPKKSTSGVVFQFHQKSRAPVSAAACRQPGQLGILSSAKPHFSGAAATVPAAARLSNRILGLIIVIQTYRYFQYLACLEIVCGLEA